MNHLIVRHKVADFPVWKSGYDAHLPARKQAGLKELKLLHVAADPNDVVLLFEVADVIMAKAFCESADLRAAMEAFGVVGPPEITFLTD